MILVTRQRLGWPRAGERDGCGLQGARERLCIYNRTYYMYDI
jgi:hypothetical protein